MQAMLVGLSPSVDPAEAHAMTVCAQTTSWELAREYRLLWPPLFQNFLINVGLKQRGLCYHFAEDLEMKLDQLNLKTLIVQRSIARAGTWREHNALVITARNQPFADGLVLDGWRNSGRLVCTPVWADHYPWVPFVPEGPPVCVRGLTHSGTLAR